MQQPVKCYAWMDEILLTHDILRMSTNVEITRGTVAYAHTRLCSSQGAATPGALARADGRAGAPFLGAFCFLIFFEFRGNYLGVYRPWEVSRICCCQNLSGMHLKSCLGSPSA